MDQESTGETKNGSQKLFWDVVVERIGPPSNVIKCLTWTLKPEASNESDPEFCCRIILWLTLGEYSVLFWEGDRFSSLQVKSPEGVLVETRKRGFSDPDRFAEISKLFQERVAMVPLWQRSKAWMMEIGKALQSAI